MTNSRALEQLRQECETFDQVKAQGAQWFALRLLMGYAGIVLLLGIAVVSSVIILNPASYSQTVIGIAATTLFVDMLSMVASIFRLVLPQSSALRLKPVTTARSAAGRQ